MRKIVLLATALTVLFFFPIIRNITTHTTSRADGIFISWTINWVSASVVEGKELFNAPLFFPYKNTLAYSQSFIPTGIINIPIYLLTSNIVLAHNLHLLAGTIVIFLAFYLLAKELYKDKIAATTAAVVFTFSSIHLQYMVHLHTYLLAGIPLSILGLIKYVKTKKIKYLALFFVAFLYQFLNDPHTGYFLSAIVGIILVFQKNILSGLFRNKQLMAYSILVFLGIIIYFNLPYFEVSNQFQYTRSIRDTAHFAFSIEKIFEIEILLLIFSIFFFNKNRNKKVLGEIISGKTLIIIAIVGAVLMLGPVLKVGGETFKLFSFPIPLPYSVLFYLVPGFKSMRASSRWILLFGFGLSLLLSRSMSISKESQKKKIVFLVFISIFFLFQNLNNFEIYEIETSQHQIYEPVKQSQKNVLLEYPVYDWGMVPFNVIENDRLLSQSFHGKTLYNGVSGFTPPSRYEEIKMINEQLTESKVQSYLKKIGVELILINYDEYEKFTAKSGENLKNKVNGSEFLELIECVSEKCLYEVKN